MPDLFYPSFRCKESSDAISSNYTFERKNVLLLENPKKGRITGILDSLEARISPMDNLLIFYAGHGNWDEKKSIGYWLPLRCGSQVTVQLADEQHNNDFCK